MSSIFARGHRICRSTRFRPPQIHATSRRHLQLDIMPGTQLHAYELSSQILTFHPQSIVSPESSTSLEAFQEPLLELPPSRLVRFNALIEFVQGGLGAKSKRAVPSRGIRSTSWNKLFMFAETAGQLEKVAEMFPKWRDMQRSFSIKASELFVRAYNSLLSQPNIIKVMSRSLRRTMLPPTSPPRLFQPPQIRLPSLLPTRCSSTPALPAPLPTPPKNDNSIRPFQSQQPPPSNLLPPRMRDARLCVLPRPHPFQGPTRERISRRSVARTARLVCRYPG